MRPSPRLPQRTASPAPELHDTIPVGERVASAPAMASQQVLFAETIAGMKKAFKRRAYDSDSDSEIEGYGNRGHKLQRRARFSNKGRLVPAEGPDGYNESIEYAGVRRSIIHRNPPLVDQDGYEVDSADDDDRIEEAMASAAELDPYSDVRIENILAPLTSASDLAVHPTLSKPFVAQTLTHLAEQSSTLMRRENRSLWQVRHLWTALLGDRIWAPCEVMIGPDDVELYNKDHVAQQLLGLSKARPNGTGHATNSHKGKGKDPAPEDGPSEHDPAATYADTSMTDADDNSEARLAGSDKPRAEIDGDQSQSTNNQLSNGSAEAPDPEPSEEQDAPDMSSYIHPIFASPEGVQSDRDLGVPQDEADNLRRLLAMFVQKQEEVCRGAQRLHDGLTRAHRLRKDVLHWSKAEAHCGPNRDMSDGEDWYDKEEWGLTEDLKKGQDDEEEDTTTTAKKTRARRQ